MACPQDPWPSDREFMDALKRRAVDQRIPLGGAIELTTRCNLDCRHCYLPRSQRRRGAARDELATPRLMELLDEIQAAGCLSLLLTGGEPLLRDDFADLYRHARERGLLVSIFSNGTLISDRHVELFAEMPPRSIEITLYGATQATYERVTGVVGSYTHCLKGIEQLLEGGVHVVLKTVLMTLNQHELDAMRGLARSLAVGFRIDSSVFPRLDGDQQPIELRLPAAAAVALELGDAETADQWRALVARCGGPPATDALYRCGAGVTNFFVDAGGRLRPCLMTPAPAYDLVDGDFAAGWRDVMPEIGNARIASSHQCHGCEDAVLCGYCPPFFALEEGAEHVPSSYLCDLARRRRTALFPERRASSGGCR